MLSGFLDKLMWVIQKILSPGNHFTSNKQRNLTKNTDTININKPKMIHYLCHWYSNNF